MIEPLLVKVLLKQDVAEEKKKLDDALKNMPKGFEVAGVDSKAEALRAQSEIDFATVIKIGPTAYNDYGVPCPIKEGDRVVIAKYAGKSIVDPVDKTIYLLVNDEDILAIIQGEYVDG